MQPPVDNLFRLFSHDRDPIPIMETIPEDHIRAWAYQKLRSYFIGIASGTGSYCIKENRRKYVSHEYQEDYCKHYPYGDGNRNQLFVPLFAHLAFELKTCKHRVDSENAAGKYKKERRKDYSCIKKICDEV